MATSSLEQKRKLEINRACKDGEKFSQLFYKAFDTRRHAISAFYMDEATLIWNGNGVNGKAAITQFYETLPTTSRVDVNSLDAQPVLGVAVNNQATILVHVMGTVKFQGKNESSFMQTFLLTAQGETWKILSDTFRFQETVPLNPADKKVSDVSAALQSRLSII